LDDDGATLGGIVRFGTRGVSEGEDSGADGERPGGRGQVEAFESNKTDDEADKQPDGNADQSPAKELQETEAAPRASAPV